MLLVDALAVFWEKAQAVYLLKETTQVQQTGRPQARNYLAGPHNPVLYLLCR